MLQALRFMKFYIDRVETITDSRGSYKGYLSGSS